MNLIIYTHNRASHSVRKLYTAFRDDSYLKRIFKSILVHSHNREVEYTQNDVVINWGSSKKIMGNPLEIINNPVYNNIVGNKLSFFKSIHNTLSEYLIPFTDDKDEAKHWISEGDGVVERHVLRGHSGKGIVIVKDEEDLTEAPLYTKLIPHAREWRLHIFNGEIIHEQEKRKKIIFPDDKRSEHVKSHKNGWVFAMKDVMTTDLLEYICSNAVERSNLIFGAVDIIMDKEFSKYYLLEVNTAPNISNTTAERYIEAFTEYLKDKYTNRLILSGRRG